MSILRQLHPHQSHALDMLRTSLRTDLRNVGAACIGEVSRWVSFTLTRRADLGVEGSRTSPGTGFFSRLWRTDLQERTSISTPPSEFIGCPTERHV